jgi:putative methanogenesis marker protein 12
MEAWKGMAFVGIDHSTTAIRVAIIGKGKGAQTFEFPKTDAPASFMAFLGQAVPPKDIEMIAIAYSMGDSISSITPILRLRDRGVRSLEGIGQHSGVGTRIFDEVRASGLPAVAIPGLHRECKWLDPRFTVLQSHLAAPKKVAASIYCLNKLSAKKRIRNLVVANVSSNTVSVLIRDGRIVGAVDAALGALGLRHGPIDVEAIRRIDRREISANEAFSTAGILRPPYDTTDKLFKAIRAKDRKASLLLESLIMAVAMEVGSLVTVSGGVNAVALTGGLGEVRVPVNVGARLGVYLGMKVQVFSRFSAAMGAAEIARLVKEGADEIVGVPVER